jgi:hypothetical protein
VDVLRVAGRGQHTFARPIAAASFAHAVAIAEHEARTRGWFADVP